VVLEIEIPLMSLQRCGHCGHSHHHHCPHKNCNCDHPTTHPRPIPDTIRITALLKERNLNYATVAQGMGMSYTQVWRVMNGKTNPSYTTLRSMAVVLGVTIDSLMELLGIKWRKP
jgi:DNA-binding XRE family transcriptional regulator